MKRLFSLLACLAVVLSLSIPAFATELEAPTQTTQVQPYSTITLDETASTAPSDSIPGVLTALFGEYTPRTQTVTQYLSDGTEVSSTQIVPGLAGLDWLWLSSVVLFGMGLYCVFRAIGGCLRWN